MITASDIYLLSYCNYLMFSHFICVHIIFLSPVSPSSLAFRGFTHHLLMANTGSQVPLPHPPILFPALSFPPLTFPSTPPFLWQYFTAQQCNVFGLSADTSLETSLNSSTMVIRGNSGDGGSMEKWASDYNGRMELEKKKERKKGIPPSLKPLPIRVIIKRTGCCCLCFCCCWL